MAAAINDGGRAEERRHSPLFLRPDLINNVSLHASTRAMFQRYFADALVELPLPRISVFLQFLLFLPQTFELVFDLCELGDVALHQLFLLFGLAERARRFARLRS